MIKMKLTQMINKMEDSYEKTSQQTLIKWMQERNYSKIRPEQVA